MNVKSSLWMGNGLLLWMSSERHWWENASSGSSVWNNYMFNPPAGFEPLCPLALLLLIPLMVSHNLCTYYWSLDWLQSEPFASQQRKCATKTQESVERENNLNTSDIKLPFTISKEAFEGKGRGHFHLKTTFKDWQQSHSKCLQCGTLILQLTQCWVWHGNDKMTFLCDELCLLLYYYKSFHSHLSVIDNLEW